ncbi:MAG: hypothetical protein KAT79_07870, partial [candidate division Zixibacteria bacterium]|nr:hypothetical protein [candidate division Zixibacteria bacterium]
MEYGKIVSKSFNVAWNYKSLWIFGLFAGAGSSGFNWNTGETEQLDFSSFGFDTSVLADIYHILAPLLIWFGLLLLALICLSFIAAPALIDAVNRITRGGTYR